MKKEDHTDFMIFHDVLKIIVSGRQSYTRDIKSKSYKVTIGFHANLTLFKESEYYYNAYPVCVCVCVCDKIHLIFKEVILLLFTSHTCHSPNIKMNSNNHLEISKLKLKSM